MRFRCRRGRTAAAWRRASARSSVRAWRWRAAAWRSSSSITGLSHGLGGCRSALRAASWAMQVVVHGALGAHGVALLDGVEQHAVFVDRRLPAGRAAAAGGPAIRRRKRRRSPVARSSQRLAASCLHQRVEVVVGDGSSHLISAAAAWRSSSIVQVALPVHQRRVVDMARSACQGGTSALEQAPSPGTGASASASVSCTTRASAARHQVDQAFGWPAP
jgi:hypothetical protein